MKTKLNLIVLMAAICAGGSVRADVAGLTAATDGGNTYTYAQNAVIGRFDFSTTGNSGNSFTGISFAGLFTSLGTPNIYYTQSVDVKLYTSDNTLRGTSTINYTDTVSTTNTYSLAGVGGVGAYQWLASTSYYVTVDANDSGVISRASTGTSLTNGIPDWINTATQVANASSVNGAAFTLYAAVPEPTTMVLTGTALAAGAVGAWWKRRRKTASQVTV